ncbi:MAG: Hsp20/alpha crystallin family protein [Bacteroidota bacterium]
MSLIKRNPAKEMEVWNRDLPVPRVLDRLHNEMNRVFSDFFRGDLVDNGSFFPGDWGPAVDLSETDDSYIIRAEIPGMKKEDVKITLLDSLVTIRGEKKNEAEEKNGTYHRIERSYGSFERSFNLPGGVKSGDIEAKYNDGLLTITLPKTEEAKEKVHDIKIK